MKQAPPPQWMSALLIRFLPAKDRDFLMGDFELLFFDLIESHGRSRALGWYASQLFKSAPRFFVYRFYLMIDMVVHAVKVGCRQMHRTPVYSLINVTGLGLGMAVCLFIYLWTLDELSFDRFHPHADRIFRVVQTFQDAGQAMRRAVSPLPLGPALRADVPGIERALTLDVVNGYWPVKRKGDFFQGVTFCQADPEFFSFFCFPLIQGDSETALQDPSGVVLTQQLAYRLFGEEDPMGQALSINGRDCLVTGLMADVPRNSHLKFDAVVSIHGYRSHPVLNRWRFSAFTTFLELSPGVEAAVIQKQISALIASRTGTEEKPCTLQPLTQIHLHSDRIQSDYAAIGSYRDLILFGLLALLILFIAGVNFINLTTARASQRVNEMGLRKALGASKASLVRQLLGETLFMIFGALVVALGLMVLFLPTLNHLTGKQLVFLGVDFKRLLWAMGPMVLCVGLLAVFSPVFTLLGGAPFRVQCFDRGPGRLRSRRVLLAVQFMISLSLMAGALVIQRQLTFIQRQPLGYDRNNLLIFMVTGGFYTHYEAMKDELLAHPDVLAVGRGFQPLWHQIQTHSLDWEGQPEGRELAVQCYGADADYFKTWGMAIVAGRAFNPVLTADTANVLINETAAKAMGLERPLGRWVSIEGRRGQIIGVVRDFHHASLHHDIQPIVFRIFDSAGMAVKVRNTQKPVMGHLKRVWASAVPEEPFDPEWFASKIDGLYDRESRLAWLFNGFTVLALGIAGLGLLGLAAFLAESRTKELGIRKVMGASVFRLLSLIQVEFAKLMALAMLVAWPVSMIVMEHWLRQFAYRISFPFTDVIVSGVILALLAWILVGVQVYRVVRKNPVQTLRYE